MKEKFITRSAMYEAAQRFNDRGQPGIVLYLGDHDPSGEDMVRDIQSRCEVQVLKVALTMEQVNEHNPPPNPAKATDSRFKRYEAEHGNESWEVDALPPNVLVAQIRDSIRDHVQPIPMQEVIKAEKADKARFAQALDEVTKGKSKVDRRRLTVESPPFHATP